MNQAPHITSKPQMALQSYLDGLLQEATEPFELPPAQDAPVAQPVEQAPGDEFEAAVREEQARDAQRQVTPAAPAPRPFAEPQAKVLPTVLPPATPVMEPVVAVVEREVVAEASIPLLTEPPAIEPAAPLVELHVPAAPAAPTPPATVDGRPEWAAEPFECLLFDVAGLTLAVPLVCLGSIYTLAGQELTPLFGQPDWFLGILTCQAGNLKVLDTARWVMPDRYRDDFRQGLQYVISVQGYEWGLAVHQVSRSLRLDPSEIKWRSQRGQRPWLAGTVIEHMCALLDVAELAELIASGAVKQMNTKHN
ncbi:MULTISPECIES: CheW domain-containing protein [unclassified Pseudomonas]|uniref:CheW domain-containing protein n=1 Tax=unclassified Pseudomonas TaxID=196821 RepID=UPI000C88C64D|nr:MULTISPECIES: CheW domain-containing protein [unclassified Pseudomonas]PMZ89449.1 chemotaxis protein CheW [Pseudomonas sp. FW305-42]PNA19752.1 chemotaxis protein CheW [Pseudomonas sp. MPR-R1B]PNB22672.1 chemotaxis protein CheW [Pseudomonas sp. DP16D-E2]PNB40799.1 chemotaxis protein CheW [Pseudomonas sp. FW305-17]PNB56284.1 chemotaxis protein CheW [Pseudomonas sp. GW531-E2]